MKRQRSVRNLKAVVRRVCAGHMDVPYTEFGNVVWRKEPCSSDAMLGSKFCRWHHKPDLLPPEFVSSIFKPNKGVTVAPTPGGA